MKRLLLIALFFIVGCKETVETPPQGTQPASLQQTGIVAEMIEVENYTYMRLESNQGEAWIATLPTWVSQGDVIEFTGGAIMKDFYSETLGRKFDSILFVDNVRIVERPSADEIVTQAHTASSHTTNPVPPKPAMSVIEQIGDSKSVAEILADYAEKEGETVRIRAKVVKVNSGILGKNWVTLQDGTGTAPNDHLVSTTLESVALGELVDVTAVIKKNVDLGYGYEFAVLLEDAKFSRVEETP